MDYSHMPPEQRAFYEGQEKLMDQVHMEGEAKKMEYARFFERLSISDLKLVRDLIYTSRDDASAQILIGILGGCMVYKHDLDFEGRSAEEELLNQTRVAKEKFEDIAFGPSGKDAQAAEETETLSNMMLLDDWDKAIDEDKTRIKLMRQYGIEQGQDPADKTLYLRCTGCHTFVHSLKDRMLREPGVDGCETCQNKVKWG